MSAGQLRIIQALLMAAILGAYVVYLKRADARGRHDSEYLRTVFAERMSREAEKN